MPEAKPKTVRIESLQSNNKNIIRGLINKIFKGIAQLVGGLWTICG